jgi:hypothetical protein
MRVTPFNPMTKVDTHAWLLVCPERRVMARPEYYAYCPHCGYQGFSHDSQGDAERVVRNHAQRCEENPNNYSWQDAADRTPGGSKQVKVSGSGCALIGVLLLSVPAAILYGLVEWLA